MIVPKQEQEKRLDSAVWTHHKLSNGVVCVTTEAFNDIMNQGPKNLVGDNVTNPRDFIHLLNLYKRLARSGKQDRNRHQISKGAFAQFFSIGNSKIGIREEKRRGESSIKDKMMRMDVIQHFLDVGGIPRWVQKPSHYAYMTVPNKEQDGGCVDYLLMDKVDGGVTVEDIKNGCRNEKIRRALFVKLGKTFGFSSESDKSFRAFRDDVLQMYEQMVESLKENFVKHRAELWDMCGHKGEIFCFEDLFTDLAEKNIVVNELNPPTGGKRIGFWIIDQ